MSLPPLRTTFNYTKNLYWYPGHMVKSLRLLQDRHLPNIDILLEVRDARLPISSINPEFEEMIVSLGKKRRFVWGVVYNKVDLADSRIVKILPKAIKEYYTTSPHLTTIPPPELFFTTTSTPKSLHPVLNFTRTLPTAHPTRYPFLKLLIIGMPNVGKSSLVNVLRNIGISKRKCASVAPTAGHTKSFGSPVLITDSPANVYLIDSPGILNPCYVSDPIQGLKIAAVGGTNENLVDLEVIADYVLFVLNRYSPGTREAYTSLLKLTAPTDDIKVVIEAVGKKYGLLTKGGEVNEDGALKWFLQLFRKGKFGRMEFDGVIGEGKFVESEAVERVVMGLRKVREEALAIKVERDKEAELANAKKERQRARQAEKRKSKK